MKLLFLGDFFEGLLERRKEIIEMYDSMLHPIGVQSLQHFGEDFNSTGHLYLARIPSISEEERNEIIIKMAEDEIATNVHYKPLPTFTAYKNLGFHIKDYPNAYAQYANEITLPLHTLLSDEDVEYVDSVNFIGDWKIIFLTLKKVFVREGINSETSVTMEPFKGSTKEVLDYER